MSTKRTLPTEFPKFRLLEKPLAEEERDTTEIASLEEKRAELLRDCEALPKQPRFNIERDGALLINARAMAEVIPARIAGINSRRDERNDRFRGLCGARGELHDAVINQLAEIQQEVAGSVSLYASGDALESAANDLMMRIPCARLLVLLETQCRGTEVFPADAYVAFLQLDEFLALRAEWQARQPANPPPTVSEPAVTDARASTI